MTLEEVTTRIRKLTRVNLKIADYLKQCDIAHRAADGGPCQDPRCKAIARKYQSNEDLILELMDIKYAMIGTEEKYNVIGSLLSS